MAESNPNDNRFPDEPILAVLNLPFPSLPLITLMVSPALTPLQCLNLPRRPLHRHLPGSC